MTERGQLGDRLGFSGERSLAGGSSGMAPEMVADWRGAPGRPGRGGLGLGRSVRDSISLFFITDASARGMFKLRKES